ncbi:MAG: hypothetical protein HFI85_04320 [Clostridia bacterium]|jgi:hypothetical protein|nr:hypothetical protein [Clostridia bacterium]
MIETVELKNRVLKNPNRRKIVIQQQNANEVIADIIPLDEEIIESGTALNAELFNNINKSIKSLNDSVVAAQGTRVKVGNSFVAEFNADNKADKSSVDAVKQRVASLESSSLMTKIRFDATTNTFII